MTPFLLKSESAQYYECGFSCDHGLLLVLPDARYFITDGRYVTAAKELIRDAEVVESRRLIKTASTLIRKEKIRRLIYDPVELLAGEEKELARLSGAYLIPRYNFHQYERIIKSEEEVSLIQTSIKLNQQAFKKFARYLSEEGVGQEERRLHYAAQGILQDFGRYELSFDPIVAVNATAAKPHALPSKKKLRQGDLMLLDAGIKYERYCSDRSRTTCIGEEVSFGKKQTFARKKRQKIYDIVLKAQERAISKARAGMRACEVDALAREVIEKEGYGDCFVHSTGHGIGLDIHELPVISARSETIIKEGMVFTIEPGIYLPDDFGVRIEDCVVIQGGKAEVL